MAHYRVMNRKNEHIGNVIVPLGQHYECLIIDCVPYITMSASQLGAEIFYREATFSDNIEMKRLQ